MGSSSDLPIARHRWNGSTLTLKVRFASRSELPSARHRWNVSMLTLKVRFASRSKLPSARHRWNGCRPSVPRDSTGPVNGKPSVKSGP